MTREFHRVGVVGLGTMGAGIVEVFARNSLDVVAIEWDDAALERGRGHVTRSTDRAVTRGKLGADEQRSLLARISYGTELAALADVDLVVEAIPERLELKRTLFTKLHEICQPEAILATNTSSLSVTEIAVATGRPGKVIGLHFFNPAPVMKLVEIVRSVITEPDVVDDVETFAQQLGKVDVTIGDRAGFIANALLFGYLNHAAALYESQYASREDIDAAMMLSVGLPMGPLALLDLIGLDTSYEILATMYKQSRDRLHAPVPVLRQMITAGMLGRKSGRGFYTYDRAGGSAVAADALSPAGVSSQPPTRPVQRVGVVGAGTLATGIAQVFATAGLDVTRVTPSSRFADLAAAQLVIEAVADDLAVKKALFAELDTVCAPGAVLATTTSSLPIIECAAATSRPADVVGMHFFEPATATKLVEVISTMSTAADVEATALDLARRVGKHAVRCGDRAGFIVNALLFPYLNDAVRMLEANYASADDIDSAMKLGCGFPQGPFELLDEVGNDVAVTIQRALYREFREPGFAPAPLLEQLVTAGRLGRKTGQGFRDHR
ncbi:MAG: 3-hydroxybutyryl-CoA dehydrogenase [Actinomycetota bacterium]